MEDQKCKQEISTKKKKSAYKKWWFWLLMALATIFTIGIIGGGDSTDDLSDFNEPNGSISTPVISNEDSVNHEVVYEKFDLQTMLDELDTNALRAKEDYQNKHIEIVGKISNIDSAGKYISIEPEYADAWNFQSILCDLTDNEQRTFVASKNVGDVVTVQGKITSVGEVLGYSLDVESLE